MVNKGASSVQDWVNNIVQPLGLSMEIHCSLIDAREFVAPYPDSENTMIGHFRVGAETAANAVAIIKNCIIFNPAGDSLLAYGLIEKNYTAHMTAYIAENEILNSATGFLSQPIDIVVYLPAPNKLLWMSGIGKKLIKNQLMTAVKWGLLESGEYWK